MEFNTEVIPHFLSSTDYISDGNHLQAISHKFTLTYKRKGKTITKKKRYNSLFSGFKKDDDGPIRYRYNWIDTKEVPDG